MIVNSECLGYMKTMEPNSVGAIVTDPPYGLGFMGKDWDAGLPHIDIWKEALRICKPGSWLLAFGGTRTHHRQACTIEDAGWEIRDCIMWLYGSGFPKGRGCLKPSYEPIVLARKPGCKVSDNFLNIDDCRIGNETRFNTPSGNKDPELWGMNRGLCGKKCKGRWPANTLWDEEAASDLGNLSRFFYCAKASSSEKNEGLEELPDKVGGGMCSTLSGDSRTGRVTIQKNNHPTVKPLKLMEYLIKLVMPKEGLLLDPFAGSGSTLVAAKRLGINAVGIEQNLEYAEIARARIGHESL